MKTACVCHDVHAWCSPVDIPICMWLCVYLFLCPQACRYTSDCANFSVPNLHMVAQVSECKPSLCAHMHVVVQICARVYKNVGVCVSGCSCVCTSVKYLSPFKFPLSAKIYHFTHLFISLLSYTNIKRYINDWTNFFLSVLASWLVFNPFPLLFAYINLYKFYIQNL